MLREAPMRAVQGEAFRLGQDKKTATTGEATTEQSRQAEHGAKVRPTRLQGKDRDMGTALRSVYQQTVEEAIPDDLLDLLGKLG